MRTAAALDKCAQAWARSGVANCTFYLLCVPVGIALVPWAMQPIFKPLRLDDEQDPLVAWLAGNGSDWVARALACVFIATHQGFKDTLISHAVVWVVCPLVLAFGSLVTLGYVVALEAGVFGDDAAETRRPQEAKAPAAAEGEGESEAAVGSKAQSGSKRARGKGEPGSGSTTAALRQRKPDAKKPAKEVKGDKPDDKPDDKKSAAGAPAQPHTAVLSLTTTDKLALALLTVLAGISRFWNLTEPRATLFDEVHFGKFTNHHVNQSYYFDIHPPFVKFILHGMVGWTGYAGNQPFATIGEPFLETTPVWMFRAWPALTGVALVPVTFLIGKRLGLSLPARFLCAWLVLTDLLFLGESRMILTDSSLILFAALSFLCFLTAEACVLHSREWHLWTALTGVFLAMTITTKWTGLSVFGLLGICTLTDMLRRSVHNPSLWSECYDLFVRLVLLLGIPAVFYITNYYLFFAALPNTGFGAAFMLPDFQSSLVGHEKEGKFPPPTFWESFVYLQSEMFRANKDIATPHHWQSFWYDWPLMGRPINCYTERKPSALNHATRRVYLFGNPMVWWFCVGCIAVSPVCWFVHSYFKKRKEEGKPALSYRSPMSLFPGSVAYRWFQLYAGYAMSILPFALVQRACFIYHYMPSLLFSIVMAGVVLDSLFSSFSTKLAAAVGLVVGAVCAWGFYFWGPLVYGLPLSSAEYKDRVWYPMWT